jgi:type III pantothenate kinase
VLVDVGNTSVHFARYAKGVFSRQTRVPTRELSAKALRDLDFLFDEAQAAVVASVVPFAGKLLKGELVSRFGLKTFLIGPDFPAPIVNRYRKPSRVGTDRLVNAVAAFHEFKKELVILDFGTAITFDVVSRKGEYLGGVIAPGIEISLDALFQRTALLPRTRLEHPSAVIGRDTAESIRIGCSYGIGGLCDRMVDTISRKHRLKPVVLATGGYARFMKRYCRSVDRIDDDLTLKGILLTYKKALDKKSAKNRIRP